MKKFLVLLLAVSSTCQFSCKDVSVEESQVVKEDYTKYVDTRIGTEHNGKDCGKTFVGAGYPFGLMQMTPDLNTPHKGIAVNQISGAGCNVLGNFPVRPFSGKMVESPASMDDFPLYDKVNSSTAGYLSINYEDILAESTVSKRSGMIRVTYGSETKDGTVAIGSGVNSTFITNSLVSITSPTTCEGYAYGGEFCGEKAAYTVYFAAEFNRPATVTGTWNGDLFVENRNKIGGNNCGAYFTFDVSSDKKVEYKVAISYVSVENAKENLKADNQNRSFDQVKAETNKVWNEYLGKIEVEDKAEDLKKQFYTHWYHTLLHPNIFDDVNGEYMGADYQVHKVEQGHNAYTTYSAWDTYRTQCQIVAMFFPEEASDMMQSCVNFADQAGGYGRWVLANVESGIMHGDPIPIIISNSYAYGAKNFDTKKAFEHMKRGACVPKTYSQFIEVRPGLDVYLEKGIENASLCLEYTSSDYAIGQYALQAMNDKKEADYFINRSKNWKNLYDPSTNWLRSRENDDMSWKDVDADWREATKVNYFWMVPYDLTTLIDTIGGKSVASARLDTLFVKLDAGYDEKFYAAGNEPDFQVPWIYNWTDQPYKTSEVIKRILKEVYNSSPSGLPGNDDCGSMGAWFVYSCVGLYPMVPGVAGFSINAPQFDSVKMHFPKGVLTIKRDKEATYIQDATLNGKKCDTWIDWSALENGGVIEYKLSDEPNKQWGIK